MKLLGIIKMKHMEMAAQAFIQMGGKPPASAQPGKWRLAWWLAAVQWFFWLISWPGFFLGRQLKRAWINRKNLWVYAGPHFERFKWFKRANTRRRQKMLQRCNSEGHTLLGTLLENGQPGKMCEKCKYIQQITPKEFKRLFRMPVHKAIAQAQRQGRKVINADKYLAIH